ncbi:LuxR family maltose regulon positive regulatory protein [Jatrophihabitans sp. GAS493]|uniref:LuxR C-terminal-related transcriptional regulator n=1 Tax=Jatrophihabitans sp. GAS493 TaxID=1907575 RepID=UPI000BC00A4A|nr:LuxR C-terminal-related transcriptional regulator [Jatrophihabitans sp. GAS493]SOD72467.1 LuxR family maltose regulon positive regulatory protein [Jatrophihabitans sp. GAS493]
MSSYSPLARKVTPTALPARLISRPRLTGKLDDGVQGPLTLVAAGPGSGKTVLLGDWANSQQRPIAWVSLDAPDNDPDRFWPLVGLALQTAGLIAENEGLNGLPHDQTDTGQFMAALVEALPGSQPVTLVLDDAHVLSNPSLLAEIDAVIRYGFPRWRIVLSTRSDPLLPLHRYRLAGQMTELRADDLAMTRAEARALLTAHDVTLRQSELAMLTHRTEGWAAGLRLSAMSMAGSRDPGRFVTQLALDQGSVGEYLMEEVLDRQSAPARRLLIQTSFLDEVTGPLAAAVTGIENSSELLADMARTNSFVIPQGNEPGRYRYHQLLAEILNYLSRREYGKETLELRKRAAAWFEANGDPSSAMRFAVEAHDWPRASSVLIRGGFAKAFIERKDILDLGLGNLLAVDNDPEPTSDEGSDAKVAQAVVAAVLGRLDVAREHLQQARTRTLTADADATAALVEVIAAQQDGSLSGLDAAASTLLAERHPVDAVRTTTGLRSAVQLTRAAHQYWEFGPRPQFDQILFEALDEAHGGGMPGLELECLGYLQLAYTVSGRGEHANDCELKSQTLVRRNPQLQRTTVHHLANATAAYLQTDLNNAARFVSRAEQTKIVDADPPLRAAVALMHGWILIASGRVADAHHHLMSAPELGRSLPGHLARSRARALAEIETRMGRPHAALKAIGDSAADLRDPMLAMAGARAFIALGDADAARDALRPALISSDNTAPLPVLIEVFLTSAKVAELGGNDARAVEEVMRATGLATESITQPFADARPMLDELLRRHPEAVAAWPNTGSSGELDAEQVASPRVRSLAEPLTDRETAVLRRLATTMTTAEIGNELCVSINTVKTHIAAIYRKLPAAGRRDAVARARQLELL